MEAVAGGSDCGRDAVADNLQGTSRRAVRELAVDNGIYGVTVAQIAIRS